MTTATPSTRRARARVALLLGLLLCVMPREAFAQARLPSSELLSLQELASEYYKAGDLREALATSERALALAVREFGADHEQTAIQTYGIAYVAEALGDLALAERQYRESLRVREIVYGRDSAGSAQAMERLARIVLRQGRVAEAEALSRRVLAIRSALVGGDHAFNATAHADLGAAALARNDTTAALASYREAVRLLVGQKAQAVLARSVMDDEIRRNRDVFAGLAEAAWHESRTNAASRSALLAEAFAASQQAWSTSAASALARMSARIGTTDTALGRRIRTLQDTSERILALHEEDMRALAAWSQVQRSDTRYAALQEEFRQASIAQSRDTAPTVARQKALVDQLQKGLTQCPPGQRKAGCETAEADRKSITDELGRLSAATQAGSAGLMEVVRRMQAAEAALPGHREFTEGRRTRLDDSQRLERQAEAERKAIVATFPDYVALTEPKPLTPADVQRLVGPREALVAILDGPRRSYVWVITRERVEWAEIAAGTAELAARVAELRQGLDPFAGDGVTDVAALRTRFDLGRASELYALVLAPVAGALAGKDHLLLVPSGPLSSLPFQVLLTGPSPQTGDRATDLRQAPWLIRRHALSVLPSVQSLAAIRRLSPANRPLRPFLGIGDPALTGPGGDGQQQRGRRVAGIKPAMLYRNGAANLRAVREMTPLPETADELRQIATVLKAPAEDILLRDAATETRVAGTALDQYRIVHFATHGLVAGELSGLAEPALVLTPPAEPISTDDGLLTASDVAALKLSADWVVLSACNTAAGSDVGAEALSGLARAFFYAGARTLMVSHWAVNSKAAVDLTTRTFQSLAADPALSRAEAFRRTMLSLIDGGEPPSFWAPFVIVGEGSGGG